MKKLAYTLLVFVGLSFVTLAYAQGKRYIIKNGIGIQGGISQFDILTDNFETQSNSGFIGGFDASVEIPHKWYNVSYNILLSQNHVDISASPTESATTEFVEYKLFTAQISFLLHTKLIGSYLTLDLGPMLQYNGELELKDTSKEGYIITGLQNLLTEDISDITRFNVNGAIGLTASYGRFKIRAQYIYGFTNMLGRLNNQELNISEKLKGNQSMLSFTAIISL